MSFPLTFSSLPPLRHYTPLSDQPENLILHTDEKGQDTVKLIDFGFAHVNDTQDAMMHTACTLLATSLAFLPHPPSLRPSRRPHTPPVVFMHPTFVLTTQHHH